MSADEQEYRSHDADSRYHRTLPIGERLSGGPLVDDRLSCFEEVTLKAFFRRKP